MAIDYRLDLYPRLNPVSGQRVRRLSHLQDWEYRGDANGTGSGRIEVRATSADGAALDPLGLQYIRVERLNALVTLATSAAGDDIIDTAAPHGLAIGDKVEFASLTGGTGLNTTDVYFVVSASFGASTFRVSLTRGGSPINFTSDITAGTVRKLTTVGGFFLEKGEFEALTDKSTKRLSFGGAGTLSYLFRGVAADQTYIAGADGPYDDTWHWHFSPAGSIFWRMVTELLDPDRPQNPIAGVTMTFDQSVDSDGNAWPGYGISWLFTIGTTEGAASWTRRLMEAGVYVWMDPDTFELSAWMSNAHGRDRTGGAWDTDVVRFQAPTAGAIATGNVKSDAKRGIAALVKRSDLLVGSKDNYEWVNDPSAEIVWEGGYLVEDPSGTSFAEIGAVQLGARSDAGDTVRLRMKLGDDPSNGYYLPFEHVQLDDRITLHNGSGQWDWDESEQKVARISLKLRSDGDVDAWVDLGSQFASIEDKTFQVEPVGAHSHPPNPPLCNLTHNVLRGLPASKLKADSEEINPTWSKEKACDGDDSTHWSGHDTAGEPVAEAWWAADLTIAQEVTGFRILENNPADAPQNIATEIRLYGSDSPSAWSWLPSGHLVADPASNGWILVATVTNSLASPQDTSSRPLGTPQTFRYWLFRAVTGGTDEWDVNEFELLNNLTRGNSSRAARCDHNHILEWLLTHESDTDLVLRPDGSGGVAFGPPPPEQPPETPFHHHDLPHGYNLTKRGVVIERGGSGSWKEALVESPNVFWYPPKGQYGMVFVGYSGTPASPSEAAIGIAWADSPDGPWSEPATNPLFTKSGAGADSHGTSGPLIWYEDGVAHLFYIGLTAAGYEAGTKTICRASTSDADLETATWTRHGAVISPSGSGWRDTAIWHPNIVKRAGVYYLFFNATGDPGGTECIGYATSEDLATWTVDDTNSPVLSQGTSGQWDDGRVGDPFVYRIGETWYMAFYGNDGTNSQDGLAFTSDDDFPLGWTKFADNPVLPVGASGDFDHKNAARPAIWLTPARYYHFYSSDDGSTPPLIQIALATEDGVMVDELAELLDVSLEDLGTGDRLRYDESDALWRNTRRVWMPLTTVVAGAPELVWDDDDSLIPTEVST